LCPFSFVFFCDVYPPQDFPFSFQLLFSPSFFMFGWLFSILVIFFGSLFSLFYTWCTLEHSSYTKNNICISLSVSFLWKYLWIVCRFSFFYTQLYHVIYFLNCDKSKEKSLLAFCIDHKMSLKNIMKREDFKWEENVNDDECWQEKDEEKLISFLTSFIFLPKAFLFLFFFT
jgi:hypothetical protein